MPIYNFKLIPYLYDAFKPFLVSHLILFDDSLLFKEMDDDFFNINYEHYGLSVGKLLQSFINIVLLAIIIVILHVVFMVLSKSRTDPNSFIVKKYRQFRWNVYLRFFMLAYFDCTFFSAMKIIEGNNSTGMRKAALFMSYVFFVISIVAPIFLVVLLLMKFHVLKMKEMKASFNSLVLKIDKANKWRVVNVAFFFGRRIVTAMLLCLPITTKYIFLQYVFILVTSHAYILYMVAVKPYQTPLMNTFVLANETFYSALIILIFIFSDATP